MHVQGEDYLQPNAQLLGDLVWFFAHEMTHLHQFAEGGYGEPWMDEGFADALATETLASLGAWDQAYLERRYWSVTRECARELARGPLDGARGRVAYVCGDLVGIAVMGLLPGVGLPRLWKDARRGRGRVDMPRFLEVLRASGATEAGVEAIRTFVVEKHANTDKAILDLLEAGGLHPRLDASGGLSTMVFPFAAPRAPRE